MNALKEAAIVRPHRVVTITPTTSSGLFFSAGVLEIAMLKIFQPDQIPNIEIAEAMSVKGMVREGTSGTKGGWMKIATRVTEKSTVIGSRPKSAPMIKPIRSLMMLSMLTLTN